MTLIIQRESERLAMIGRKKSYYIMNIVETLHKKWYITHRIDKE